MKYLLAIILIFLVIHFFGNVLKDWVESKIKGSRPMIDVQDDVNSARNTIMVFEIIITMIGIFTVLAEVAKVS